MKSYHFAVLIFSGVLAAAGCSQRAQENKESQAENLKLGSAHGPGSSTAAASNEGLTFAPSPEWRAESPSSSNRKAQFKLPRAAGDSEDAELVVYYFQGGGGAVQTNVNRWIGQFTKPDGSPVADTAKIAHRNIGGIPLTVVDVSGTYINAMQPMRQSEGPQLNYRMLGAIAEPGNGPWFIKLTGPAKTVAKWAPSFEAFLNSIKRK
jgi:hypothetical protein